MAQRPAGVVSAADDPEVRRQGGSPPGRSLGIGSEEEAVVGAAFRDMMAALGINGAPVFERLAAGQNLAQALSVPAGVVEALYARAHNWFSQGRIDRAEPLFRALCLLESRSADYWVGYGVCLRMKGQPENALRAFEAAAMLRPEWEIPHFHALELTVALKQWAQAGLCLAAYDARASAQTPPAIIRDAKRLRMALEARQAAQPPASAPTPRSAGR
ncbi:MAG: hypothetical protein ACOYJQ_13300 [Pseudochelatococcus sp.]|jgi:Tfp pilus assembly protein PilF|uniref:hypothetical protein n=1 Tax=Pseudochelatococcus sp. TaxID=2020869 RepID=UPI003D8B5B5C